MSFHKSNFGKSPIIRENFPILGTLARAHLRTTDNFNVTASSWAFSQDSTYNMSRKDLPGKLKDRGSVAENASPPVSLLVAQVAVSVAVLVVSVY